MSPLKSTNSYQFGLKSLLGLTCLVAIFFAGRLSRQSEIDKLKNPSPVRISPQQASSTFQELALRRIARSETKKRLRKDAEAQVIWAKYLNELNLDSSQQIKPNAD